MALHEDAAFVVDAVQGIVRQLDPRSLAPVGEPVRYPPGITGGTFDGEGRLWIAVPSEGTVSAVTAAKLPSAPASAAPAGSGLNPERVETYDVAEASHELVVSTLDDGVAVLDRTAGRLVRVQRGAVHPTPLTLTGPAALPTRTSGPRVPVTVSAERRVLVVGDAGEERAFTVPGSGDELSPAVAWADRFYCADEATGTIYSFDANGQLVDTIRGKTNGPLELEVRENHLFINSPDSATARVVDDKHQVREVNKYANDVLGGDPPPAPRRRPRRRSPASASRARHAASRPQPATPRPG
ncbi:hypothetical protein GCM10027614_21370 [Micromonospora vulcania]